MLSFKKIVTGNLKIPSNRRLENVVFFP
jgi:hypothetical protein